MKKNEKLRELFEKALNVIEQNNIVAYDITIEPKPYSQSIRIQCAHSENIKLPDGKESYRDDLNGYLKLTIDNCLIILT